MTPRTFYRTAALCLALGTGAAQATLYDFDTGTAGFSLYGDAAADAGAVRLTASEAGQIGSIFLDTTLDATRFHASFDFLIDQTGPFGTFRGDGLTFAWVTSPGIGGGGGELGFTGLDGYFVEVDTYYNVTPPADYDSQASSIGPDITRHVAVAEAVGNPLALADIPAVIVGNGWHRVEVAFDNGAIEVALDGTGLIDDTIAGYAGFDAYFGFTGSTGASFSRQLIDNFEISIVQDMNDMPLPATALLMGLGLLGMALYRRRSPGQP